MVRNKRIEKVKHTDFHRKRNTLINELKLYNNDFAETIYVIIIPLLFILNILYIPYQRCQNLLSNPNNYAIKCGDSIYGYHCDKSCSGLCLSDSPCNKQTGHCDVACNPGYANDECRKSLADSLHSYIGGK